MRQDNELIRKMILAVEDHPHGYAPQPLRVEGYDDETIGYHAYLIIDAGLATGADGTCLDDPSPSFRLVKLTAKGHEFAQAARSEPVWAEAMQGIKSKGVVGASLDLVKKALDHQIRSRLKDIIGE